ncbi:NAD(P)/FAD-dependent oxidoreductase [Nocardia miyunensis]|uniref:NAD(P)/FAD-dependent oxidoreductase n=1 Tax=Nocardia miyunensis TaxID=282684 RepID=UPI00082DAE7A|nr:FAD-dependent oxidoreductase [Nocardia miyunensis]
MKRFVLVGGGPAAVAAAGTLREEGFDGEIALLTADQELPYERPPLSKAFLDDPRHSDGLSALYLRSPQWYAEHGVTVRTGTAVTRLDPAARRLALADGSSLAYDAVLLATGVRAKPGVRLIDDKVIRLRSAHDATRLRDRLATATRIIVLGGGFIGCEVAATASRMGKTVVLVERASSLLERALGADLGRVLTDVHRSEGVQVKLGTIVLDCVSGADGVTVRTDRGDVEGDLVVVGAGCEPEDRLADTAGIATGNGIVTDELCRTSAEAVYAAGDVANSYHPFYRKHIRVEHHDSAHRQGAVAARAMLGGAEPYAEPHWFWSDQYEHTIQQVGRSEPTDRLVIRGSLEDLSFSAVWLREDRITRIAALNRPRDVMAVRKILFTNHSVRAEDVADMGNDLRRLTRPARIVQRKEPR